MALVLIVDDEPLIRNLMSNLLIRKGHSCAQAVNGAEAIALLSATGAEAHRYDLIVLDLMMPAANGWEVLDYLDVAAPALKARILIVSAAGAEALDTVRDRGVGAILEKPFDAGVFYAAIERCLQEVSPAEGFVPPPDIKPIIEA